MTSNSWDEMRKAKEDAYFAKKNEEALKRIQAIRPQLSPATGEAMDTMVIDGVVVHRCPKSGGIWLEAGELEQILATHQQKGEANESWFAQFLGNLKI